MLRKNYLLVFVLSLFVTACNTKSPAGKFTIEVSYKNALHPVYMGQGIPVAKVKKVQLSEIPFGPENSPVALDSANLSADNGKIELTGRGKEEGLYQLVFDNGLIVLLSNDADNIQLNVDLAKKDDYYAVTGSEATSQIKEFTTAYTERSSKVDRAFSEMDSLKHFKADDSLIIAATTEKNNQITQINDYLKQFLNKTNHPSVALFILGWASRSFTRAEFEAALNSMVSKYPSNASVMGLKKTYDAQQAQIADDLGRVALVSPPQPIGQFARAHHRRATGADEVVLVSQPFEEHRRCSQPVCASVILGNALRRCLFDCRQCAGTFLRRSPYSAR